MLIAGPLHGSGTMPTVSIAAAANLTYVLDALDAEFRHETGDVTVTAAFGASGNLFAQITHGAPFDVFLSADADYPKKLAEAGYGDAATLRTFAVGRLVLWTLRDDVPTADIARVMQMAAIRKVAIAQPKTAPYGRAAQVALETLGAWQAAQPKLVIGENISQTTQFVDTGNADVGFVAMSLVASSRLANVGHWSEVPAKLYASVPLDQACILTKHGAHNDAARQYLVFLRSDAARKILEHFGYGAPAP